MIIVKISDGLGNQLFQYAYARVLKKKTGQKVYLDVRYINHEERKEKQEWMKLCGKRSFKLNNFQISIPIAEGNILNKFNNKKNILKLFYYCKKLKMAKNVIIEEKEAIENKFLKWKNYYITGYFFKREYIQEVQKELQQEIVLKTPIVISEELAKFFKKEGTVSLHVRRGDFLDVGRNISDTQYYTDAIMYMKNKLKNPVFLVFSDDIKWVKGNIPLGEKDCIYISEMGYQDYEEMILMSMCKNNIIANSTFSYWGAWLNSNLSKIVIAPRGWRRNIIPDEWIRI